MICGNCGDRFGIHQGNYPDFSCRSGTTNFKAPTPPPGMTNARVEAKKQVDRLGWLDDAFHGGYGHGVGGYGHGGCCIVCGKDWNRAYGPKEDDIFPIDGKRGAPVLFHLACLEQVKGEYTFTWKVYQRWLETGELE